MEEREDQALQKLTIQFQGAARDATIFSRYMFDVSARWDGLMDPG